MDQSDRCTVFKDDMTELYDKVYQADGLIIASPVYEMNIPGGQRSWTSGGDCRRFPKSLP